MKKSKVTDLTLYIAFFVVSVTEGLQGIPGFLNEISNQ